MKKNRPGMNRLMAILLCFVLMMGSMGTGALAGETTAAQADAEEAYDSGASASSGEEASPVNEDAATAAEGEHSADEGAEDSEKEENAVPVEEAEDSEDEEKAAANEETENPEDEEKAAPVEESYEGDSEDTDTLIEAQSDNETMATDNEAASDTAYTVYSSVPYIERSWDGTKVVSAKKTAYEVRPVTSDGNMTSGWYLLDSNVKKSGRVNLEGDTNLILGDGYTLEVKGLYIPKGKTLTIYAQSDGNNAGKLISKPTGGGAAIGGTKDYCTAAKIYFKYYADGFKVSSAVDEVTAAMLSGYLAGRKGELPAGVSIKGISAMLESDNTLRLYYDYGNVDPNGLRFTIDGNEAELKQRKDGMHYIALSEGVYSNHLQDTHTYTVSDGTEAGTYTITASVLTYARSCANKSAEVESNLGKALYLYNRAAVAAFGGK